MLMEKAGTGGAIFRSLYRDFLKESHELLKLDLLKPTHEMLVEIASQWTYVSNLFLKVSKTENKKFIDQASEILT